MVATPIGNLADITLRALHVLKLADTIACEDTRHTQSLLRAYGIDKASSQMIALHQHNELEAAQQVIERLRLGQRIAYTSDAGTPAISDPGARLVAAVRAQSLQVIPLPGASSITTALSAAGLCPENAQGEGFVFVGFLPSKAGERAQAIELLSAEPRAIVLLEAPHRIIALAGALAVLAERHLTVARELTKQYEEIATLSAASFPGWLAEQAHRTRGEFVLVLHPTTPAVDQGQSQRILSLLLDVLPLKSAVKLAAEISGEPRNALYEAALLLKKDLD